MRYAETRRRTHQLFGIQKAKINGRYFGIKMDSPVKENSDETSEKALDDDKEEEEI